MHEIAEDRSQPHSEILAGEVRSNTLKILFLVKQLNITV